MRLEHFTPRFPLELQRPGTERTGASKSWHRFVAGQDGVSSIEATPVGVVVRLVGAAPILLTDQGWGRVVPELETGAGARVYAEVRDAPPEPPVQAPPPEPQNSKRRRRGR